MVDYCSNCPFFEIVMNFIVLFFHSKKKQLKMELLIINILFNSIGVIYTKGSE